MWKAGCEVLVLILLVLQGWLHQWPLSSGNQRVAAFVEASSFEIGGCVYGKAATRLLCHGELPNPPEACELRVPHTTDTSVTLPQFGN